MAPLLLYIVWHSEVLAADVYHSPSGILKIKLSCMDFKQQQLLCGTVQLIWLPANIAMVKVVSKCYLHLHIK